MARDVCLWIQRCPSATTASSCQEASPPSIYRTPSESCLFLWLSCQLNHSLCKVVSLFVRPEGRPLEDGLPAGGKAAGPISAPRGPGARGGGGRPMSSWHSRILVVSSRLGRNWGFGGGGEGGRFGTQFHRIQRQPMEPGLPHRPRASCCPLLVPIGSPLLFCLPGSRSSAHLHFLCLGV